MLVHVDDKGAAFLDACECGEHQIFGDNGSYFAVNRRVQDELKDAELGTDIGLQLCERCDVDLHTSTVSIALVVIESGVTVLGGVFGVVGKGRHFWCCAIGSGKCLKIRCKQSWLGCWRSARHISRIEMGMR